MRTAKNLVFKMATFGPATFIHSRFLNKSVLKCRSARCDDSFFRFTHMETKSTKFGRKSYYACLGCRKLMKRGTVARVSVLWTDEEKQIGTVVSDPDLNHVSGCIPMSHAEILGGEMEKEVFCAVRNGKRPVDAHFSAQSSIPKRANLENVSGEEVIANFRDNFEMGRQLRRHQQYGIPRIVDTWDIPENYRATHRSKHCSGEPERWLLYSNANSGVLIFASDSDLLALSQSKMWFADGTFQMCPKEFHQLYFIHSEYRGEPMPLVYCLLRGKTEAIYLEVFNAISQMTQRVLPPGTPLGLQEMMMDFGSAERNAFSRVFPTARVRGCTFHYGQALIRKIGEIGLKLQYNQEDSLVRLWIRHLLSLPFLPPFLVADAWNFYLSNPLNLLNLPGRQVPAPDPHTLQLLQRFVAYFRATWMRRIEEWNHHSNDSHRTNNIPEGFHSKFKRGFGHVHASLHHVLAYLQQLQYSYYCRRVRLDAGNDPKPNKEKYQILHQLCVTNLTKDFCKFSWRIMQILLCTEMFLWPK